MKNDLTKIVISGEGGQGIQTIAKVLAESFKDSGFYVSYIPQFGPEQRGAPSISFIQYSTKEIKYPRFYKADYLIVLRERAIPATTTFVNSKTKVIFDSSTIRPNVIKQSENKKEAVPATKLVFDLFGKKNLNLIISGYLTKLFSLNEKAVWKIIKNQLQKKFSEKKDLEDNARNAFIYGYEFTSEKKNFSQPTFKTNKTIIISKNREREAFISPELCKGCGICIEKCPVGALKFGDEIGVYGNPIPEIDIDKCINCGNCFRFCPDCAIKVKKKSK